ncbi:hypothetical protein [Salinimicrobium sp. GXAS 041]|uniref:hypothetical protein n=1 Tax=Salinimicrobium sp. GXAS 041 TaxID=3400806 RepID=UPI003C724898
MSGFLGSAVLLLGILGIFYEITWLQDVSQFLLILSLFGFFHKNISGSLSNYYGFFIGLFFAGIANVFSDFWYFNYLAVSFWLICFWFLFKEVVLYTEYSKGRRRVRFYFVLVVGIYSYLLSLHVVEIKTNFRDGFQFLIYILFYLSLLVLAVTGLIYYLNSFSRKSVYFICFILSFIFSNVLQDMAIFYTKDVSVELAGLLTRFAAFLMIFLFFSTREKKLRLLNLV